MNNAFHDRRSKLILILCNAVIMVSTIAAALLYVRYIPFSYQQVGGDKLEESFLNCLEVLKSKGYTPIQGPTSKVYAVEFLTAFAQ